MKLDKINIIGIDYKIEYVDKPSDVDMYKRESLWGQIDYWTRTIRVYDNGRNKEDLFQTLLHEILHGIQAALSLDILDVDKDSKKHDELDVLALALTDVLMRNNLLK